MLHARMRRVHKMCVCVYVDKVHAQNGRETTTVVLTEV